MMDIQSLVSDVKIRLIDDPVLLKQWNHKERLIEIYDNHSSVVIPESRLTYERLEAEMRTMRWHRFTILMRWIFGMGTKTMGDIREFSGGRNR